MIGLRLLTAAVLAGPAAAAAGPPMLTDDPDTPGAGHWEINLTGAVDRQDGHAVWDLPHLDVNVGLGERTQLKAESAWAVDTADGGASGLGTTVLGCKWRGLDATEAHPAMSIYPQVALGAPTRWAPDRTREPPRLTLPLEVGQTIGSVSGAAEMGVQLQRHARPRGAYGLLVGHPLGQGEILAEIHATGSAGLIGNLGGRWRLHPRLDLIGAC